MKNQKYFLAVIVLAIIISWFLFHHPENQTIHQKFGTNEITAEVVATPVPSTNSVLLQPPVSVANANDSRMADFVQDIEQRYRQGLISKDRAVQETIMAENIRSQDFYGKVIDQYGQPVWGVAVTGELIFNTEVYGGIKVEHFASQTDVEGLVQFTGLHGAKFAVSLKKEGYIIGDRGEGYKGPVGAKTSPSDRAVLTMWKIRGPESLLSIGIDAKILHDGSPTIFDVARGIESSDGDLRVTLSRFPLEVRRGKDKYDWMVKIEMLHGGLAEVSDPYPYWAPEHGYQPFYKFNAISNTVPWQNKLEQSFYIKTSRGQYGKMQFNLNSAVTPARLHINFTINPSGSQNLEPDFSK